jgi:hypothetical protein
MVCRIIYRMKYDWDEGIVTCNELFNYTMSCYQDECQIVISSTTLRWKKEIGVFNVFPNRVKMAKKYVELMKLVQATK